MKLLTMRLANLILALAVLLLVHSVSRGQSPSPAPSPNRFVGTWKLNVEKSSPGLVSKFVIVESQGNDFKITLETVRENGYKSYSWAVTSMKGEVVKTFGKDGKPRIYENNGQSTAQEWRITLDGADAFLLDWLGPNPLQQKYEISPDGKSMTIYDIPGKLGIIAGKIDSNGRLTVVKHIEVLDKLSSPR